MWSPVLLAKYNLRRPHIVDDNVTLRELSAMYDALESH